MGLNNCTLKFIIYSYLKVKSNYKCVFLNAKVPYLDTVLSSK